MGSPLRYRTILLFCVIYLCGMILLTCSAGLVPSWAPADGEDPTTKQTGVQRLPLRLLPFRPFRPYSFHAQDNTPLVHPLTLL